MQLPDPIVYVIDDDPAVLKSICALVSSFGQQTRSFTSAVDFLENFDPQCAGCLVSDVRMFGMTGIELQEKLIRDGVQLPVILISAHAEIPVTVRAMKNGAITFLEKPCRDVELWEAIQTALKVDQQNRLTINRRQQIRRNIERLTKSEKQVLELIVEGQLNKQIAKSLGISLRTVESRRHNIFEKTQADSVAELVAMFLELKYADASSGPRLTPSIH